MVRFWKREHCEVWLIATRPDELQPNYYWVCAPHVSRLTGSTIAEGRVRERTTRWCAYINPEFSSLVDAEAGLQVRLPRAAVPTALAGNRTGLIPPPLPLLGVQLNRHIRGLSCRSYGQ